jgi:hypothetical protein
MKIVKGVQVHRQSSATQQEDIDQESLLKPGIAWLDSLRSPHVWGVIMASIFWVLSPVPGIHAPGGLVSLFVVFAIIESISPWRLDHILSSAFSRIRQFSLLLAAVVFAVLVMSIGLVVLGTGVYLLQLSDRFPCPTPSVFFTNLVVALATFSLSKFAVNAIWTIAHTIQRIRQLKRVLLPANSETIQGGLFLGINHLLTSADGTSNTSGAHEISDRPGVH